MNPFLASLIFIFLFYILNLLKQSLFPSTLDNKKDEFKQINFHKIIQLAPNHESFNNKEKQLYNSLYEAYYSKSTSASQYNYSIPQNFTNFDYNVLQQAIESQKKELLCGNDFMILIWRGMRSNRSGNSQWINFIELYKLPLLQKLDNLTIFGRTRVPKLCKPHKNPGFYQLGIVNQNRPALITFNQTGKLSLHTNLLEYLDEYSLQILIFDYTSNFWAYTSRQQPWTVKIAQKSFELKENQQSSRLMRKQKNSDGRAGSYQTNIFLEIDMLDIELSRLNKHMTIQILEIRHLFIKIVNKNLYLTCIYSYFSQQEKLKKVIQASFKIESQTLSLLSHFDIYVNKPDGEQLKTECSLFSQFETSHYVTKQIINLSCLLYRRGQEYINFVEADDIYNIKKKYKKKIKPTESAKNEQFQSWISSSYGNLYQQTQDDLLFMLKKMTPLALKQNQSPGNYLEKPIIEKYIFHTFVDYSEIKLVKPSLPDPIIFVAKNKQYYLQAFIIPTNIDEIIIKSIVYSLKKIQNFEGIEHSSQLQYNQQIRLIHYTEEFSYDLLKENESQSNKFSQGQKNKNNLIVVFWGNRIEVLQYMNTPEFVLSYEEEGVAMAVIIPFIQLFATVFCVFQTVWGASG